jgi:hypothetical protein
MITKGYILKIAMPRPDGAEYVTNIHEFKKFLEAMQTPEEEIVPKIKAAVQYQKDQIVALGFTEREADAKIDELIEKEIDGIDPQGEIEEEEIE